MAENIWFKEFPGAITITDAKGVIVAMNDQSVQQFAGDGGLDLIGKNVMDCHPEPARSKLIDLMNSPRVNTYTIQKSGRKRLIYQAPYFKEGQFAGLVELGLEIPEELPYFDRD